ncbi:MAG: hypothetical protein JWN46_247 [Acidimicrobiales bacterium]|nr:hypothetical protein [Acidimicrobiales bacterium]
MPAAWSIVDLAADPTRCVRFDVHAAYLGQPGPSPSCPSRVIGRTEGLLVEPLERPSDPRPVDLTSSTVAVTQPVPAPALEAHQLRVAIPSAGVLVTATWGTDLALVRQILASATPTRGSSTPAAPAPRAAGAPGQAAAANARVVGLDGFTGRGFDSCAAPSMDLLNAWSRSPYRAVGAYVGGANRACSQPNLTGTWVNQVMDAGWRIIPIYVGLQAPIDSCGCASIDPNQAAAQGTAAADDATARAGAVAIAPGSTIFYDMEGYGRSSTNTTAVLTFLSAWTDRLHQLGYRSGVYSSASSGIDDLAHAGSTVVRPDVIWFARWDGQPTTTGEPALAETDWMHARVHQYASGAESWGGVSLDIDRNAIDVASSVVPFVKAAYADFLGRPPTADELGRTTAQLNGGSITRAMVVQQLAGSEEWVSAIVQALYRDTLGRQGDPAGIAFWSSEIRSGRVSVSGTTAEFYASDEYYARLGGGTNSSWVSDLYKKLLHRSADDRGLSFWIGETARVGRSSVAVEFVQSPESRITRVDALYLKLLGRRPDAAGEAYWADRILVDGDLALAANLAASDEYLARAATRFA